jgi:L-methionine (R)-S-oxide reductase
VTPLSATLEKTAAHLRPHRDALVEAWVRAIAALAPDQPGDIRGFCARSVDTLLGHLADGRVEELLREEAAEARAAAQAGISLGLRALAVRVLDRCCLPLLLDACPDREALAECLVALDELGDRRLEALLWAQEQEASRRLTETQDQAAAAADRARELARANEALRRSESRSQHWAEQIAMLSGVVHRIASFLDAERLMQEAADAVQGRLNYTFVAVVVLDDEGMLIGRWAGRPGVGRRSAGRTQGPAGGVIGRALRKRAPQVVPDVAADGEYIPDVPGTRSEMVVPLLDDGEVVGAIDFQSEREAAFDLDDVAVAETLAQFLVVALRNARLFAEARRRGA